jgi:autotransporter-associated beta strand protein
MNTNVTNHQFRVPQRRLRSAQGWCLQTLMMLMVAFLIFAAGNASAAKLVNLQQFLPPGGNPQSVIVDVKNPNSILVVGATVNGNYDLNSFTYNGVAPDGTVGSGTNNRAYFAYWLHPAMGTNTLTITLSQGLYSTTRAIQAAELTGIDLSNPTNSSTSGTNNTTTITTAGNTNGAGVFVVDFTYNNANTTGDTVSPASGSVLAIPDGGSLYLGAGGQESILGSGSVAGTAGTQQLGWSFSNPGSIYTELAVAFNQALLIDVSANVSPSSGQVGDSFTVTANATPGIGSTVTNVTVDLSAIGGSSAAPLMLQGGNVYTNTFTVPSAAMAGTYILKVNALADSVPLAGSGDASFTVLSTDRTWDGASASGNNWSDPANWVGNIAPAMGANNLIFAGATRLTPDMDGDYGASGLTFDGTAGSFVLGSSGGNVLTLAGDINDNSSSAQTIDLSIANVGNTIHVYGNNNMTINGGISGGGGLEQAGSADLILQGTNSFGGAITIDYASLQIAGAGLLGGPNGNYAGLITNSGVLQYSSSATQTLSGVVSSYGTVIKDGSGKLILAGNNTYYGNTYISNGVLQVSGTLANDVGNDYLYDIADNGTLQWSSAAAQTLSGIISGTGSVIMDGGGTLNLNGDNTYSGDTVANGGTLAYNPNTVSYSTAVNSLVINGGGNVMVNASSSASLPVKNLTMNTNGVLILNYDFSGGNPTVAAVAVSGSLSAPGTNVIRISGFGATVGQFPLISYAGTLSVSMSHLVLVMPPGYAGSLVNNSGNHTIDLNVTATSPIATWYTMTGDDGYGSSSFNAVGHWSSGSAPTNDYGYYTGAHLLRTPADTNDYTFEGSALSISQYGFNGTVGRFLLKGTGNATITVTNLTLDGGLLDYADGAGGATRTFAGNILLNSGTTSYLGALVGEVMFVTAPISGSGDLQFGGGNVNGGTDVGVVTVDATNTYSGSTTVATGTLLVNGLVSNSSVSVLTNATLGGTGSISGTVTVEAGGTLAPGTPAYAPLTNSIGMFTVGGAVTISGGISMKIDRDASPNSSQLVASSVTMNAGSTITLNNIGSTSLAAGDTFTLFSTPPTGSFIVTNLPALPAGLGWTNNLAVNGTIGVYQASAGPSGPEQLTNSYSAATGILSLSWPAGQGWRLQMQTNSLTTGLGTNWEYVTDGSVSSTNITVDATKPTVFYRLAYP